ncbi:MAG: hypothetical protein H6725_17695 [Sandaracinaceae bacterium]|nr:hypothetical protein [Sandaracinaceae bacterium]
MDLSKMTREELEREAVRRGVRDVTYLTRAQLIRAIEEPPPAGALDTAKAIFRGVLGVARTLRGRPSSPPPAPAAPPAPAGAPAPAAPSAAPASVAAASTPAVNDAPGDAAGPGRTSGDTQRMRVSETPAGLPAVSRPDTPSPAAEPPVVATALEPERRPTRDRSEPTRKMKLPSTDGDSTKIPVPDLRDTTTTLDLGPLKAEVLLARGEDDPLAAAAERRAAATTIPIKVPRDADDEPIPTRTMARLLHEQGHHRRALAILEKLLQERPGDPELEADIAAVGRSLGVPRAAPGARPEPTVRAELVTMLLPDRRVLLAWGLGEASLASAKTMGASGTLVARVLVHAPGGGAVARTLTDKEVTPTGEWALGPVMAGSFVTAAVGFRDGERFVSVASAPVLDVV